MFIYFIKKSFCFSVLLTLSSFSFAHSVENELSLNDLHETPTVEQIFRAIERHDTATLDQVLDSVAWEDFVQLKHPVEGAYQGMTPLELMEASPFRALKSHFLLDEKQNEAVVETDTSHSDTLTVLAALVISPLVVILVNYKMIQYTYVGMQERVEHFPAEPALNALRLLMQQPRFDPAAIILNQSAPAA